MKKGDRLYDCRGKQVVMMEIMTKPKCTVQSDGEFYWHWNAKILQTGEVIEYGIYEDAPEYGPNLFRNNPNDIGYVFAEPMLPPYGRHGLINSFISYILKMKTRIELSTNKSMIED